MRYPIFLALMKTLPNLLSLNSLLWVATFGLTLGCHVVSLKGKSIYTSFTGGKLILGKLYKSGNIPGWHFN